VGLLDLLCELGERSRGIVRVRERCRGVHAINRSEPPRMDRAGSGAPLAPARHGGTK
jgi:hypothetical protein